MNSPKSCDWMINIFSVILRPLHTIISQIIHTLYQLYQWLTNAYKNYKKIQQTLKLRKRFVLLLSQCGECSYEDEYLKFVLNLSKNVDWIASIFISVSPLDHPRSSLSLPISYKYIKMLNNACHACKDFANAYTCFTNVTNTYENRQRMQ